jgi:hypothetical protein
MRATPIAVQAPAIIDPEVAWALEHARQVAEEEADARFGAIARRLSDGGDSRLARIIQRLAREAPGRQRGTLPPPDRARLLADRPLAAYWFSVTQAGDEGWAEERRVLSMTSAGVARLLPTWRAWGQMLIEAGEAADVEGAFRMPAFCGG